MSAVRSAPVVPASAVSRSAVPARHWPPLRRLRVPLLHLPRLGRPRVLLPRLPRVGRPRVVLPRFALPRVRLPGFARPRVLLPSLLAVVVIGGPAWYQFAFSGLRASGRVRDALTSAPIAGARVWHPRAATASDGGGAFALEQVKPREVVSVDAPGYQPQTLRLDNPWTPVAFDLQPIGVDLEPVDAETGEAIEARIDDGAPSRVRHVAPVTPGRSFSVSADGYLPAQAIFTGAEDVLRVPLRPRLDGRVVDSATGHGVAGARVALGDQVLVTDADGAYHLAHRPAAGQDVVVLAPGYRRGRVDAVQRGASVVQLQPNPVRATYMTYFAIGGDEYRQQMYRLLDATEINAVVVDIKGDYGLLSYASRVPLAQQIGANDAPTITDLDALLAEMHQHGAYVIGRIVVFKDNILARNGPKAGLEVGVKDRRTGGPWVDGEDLAWVDPFQSAAWDYNTALAREAIERGFDEVQFDYIRFPTDPSPNSSVGDIQYAQPPTEANRVGALKHLLGRAHQAVNAAGGFLSIDTFGYTAWWDDDGGIGQDLAVLADDIDYYSPMVYPSTFSAGVPGQIAYPEVVRRPYDTVFQSLKHAQIRLAGKRAVVRPWLQYFDDYPWATKLRYEAAQIEAQKQAVSDAGSGGWMLWNPGSLFTRGGLAPKESIAATR